MRLLGWLDGIEKKDVLWEGNDMAIWNNLLLREATWTRLRFSWLLCHDRCKRYVLFSSWLPLIIRTIFFKTINQMNFIIYPQKKKKKKIRIEKERRDCHRGISSITRNTVRYQRTRSRLMGSLQPVAAGERTNRDFERRKQLVLVSLTRNSCEGTRRVRYELTNHARRSDLEKKKRKKLCSRGKKKKLQKKGRKKGISVVPSSESHSFLVLVDSYRWQI